MKKSPQTGPDSNPELKSDFVRLAMARWALTRREAEVLEVMRNGASDKEIAGALGISRYTASKHVEKILEKLDVPNRTAAVSLSWQT